MTTETTPRTALHGLISCGRCGAPMRHDKATGDREALYVCDREHLTKTEVKLQARATDRLVITGVLNAILAKKSVSTPQSSSASTAAAQPEAGTPTASRVASTGAPASTRQSGMLQLPRPQPRKPWPQRQWPASRSALWTRSQPLSARRRRLPRKLTEKR